MAYTYVYTYICALSPTSSDNIWPLLPPLSFSNNNISTMTSARAGEKDTFPCFFTENGEQRAREIHEAHTLLLTWLLFGRRVIRGRLARDDERNYKQSREKNHCIYSHTRTRTHAYAIARKSSIPHPYSCAGGHWGYSLSHPKSDDATLRPGIFRKALTHPQRYPKIKYTKRIRRRRSVAIRTTSEKPAVSCLLLSFTFLRRINRDIRFNFLLLYRK